MNTFLKVLKWFFFYLFFGIAFSLLIAIFIKSSINLYNGINIIESIINIFFIFICSFFLYNVVDFSIHIELKSSISSGGGSYKKMKLTKNGYSNLKYLQKKLRFYNKTNNTQYEILRIVSNERNAWVNNDYQNKIFFTHGLLNSETKEGILFVLFHEIGHVINKDTTFISYIKRMLIGMFFGVKKFYAYKRYCEYRADLFGANQVGLNSLKKYFQDDINIPFYNTIGIDTTHPRSINRYNMSGYTKNFNLLNNYE